MASDSRPVLAVFGGSFDPPHVAHALVPPYLLVRGLAERVLVVPVFNHALGKEVAPFEQRLRLTRIAMAPLGDRVMVSDIEARLAAAGNASGYTLEMLRAVAREHPEHRVRLVIGSDILASGETTRWHRYDLVSAEFDPIVIPRSGHGDASDVLLPDISSTEVRAWLADSSTPGAEAGLAHALSPAVAAALRGPRAHLWIIGTGHMATQAHAWLETCGFTVDLVNSRTFEGRTPLRPDGVWVLVRDPKIDEVAERLLEVASLSATTPILHAAGALLESRTALASAVRRGHPAATLHPICSVRRECRQNRLDFASFGLEGDAEAVAFAESLVNGRDIVRLDAFDAEARVAYHAACSLVANHLGVPLREAVGVLRALGVPEADAERALLALMRSALENLDTLGFPRGVTGPAARGDDEAIARHLRVLASYSPSAAELYEIMSRRLIEWLPRRPVEL